MLALQAQRRIRITRAWGRMAQFLACVCLAGSLVACGGGSSDDPSPTQTPAPPASPTSVPTEAPAMTLGDVVWTTSVQDSGAPGEAVDSVPRDTPVIHAVVQVTNVPAGSAFNGVWTINGSELPNLSQTVTVDTTSTEGWVVFTLTWNEDTPWPAGTLEIAITGPDGASTAGAVEIGS